MANHPSHIGKYLIKGTIGAGAMGVVYLGEDETIGRQVAIKTATNQNPDIPDQDLAARFIQEAKILAQCHHPNIVAILDFGQRDNLAYMVMEYVDGPDLKTWLKSRKKLGLKAILSIFTQILKALHQAHSKGITHRDLKPDNILVSLPNTFKLTDFGIAKSTEQDNMTQIGITMGTPKYMAPEQMFGTDEVGPHTDIYALFVLLYELLAHLSPDKNPDAVVLSQIDQLAKHNQFKTDVMVPRAMHDFIIRGLSPSVLDRFTSTRAVSQSFKMVLQALKNQSANNQQSSDSTSGIFTTGTVITQTEAAWSFEEAEFAQMREHLADLIGPMADFILTHALKNSQSHDQLVMQIVAQLDQPKTKDAFIDRWRK